MSNFECGAFKPAPAQVCLWCLAKWVDSSHGAIKPVVLEVFRNQLGQTETLRVSPKMRIQPGKLIGCSSTKSSSNHRFVWIKNHELGEKFLRFPSSILH